MQNALPQGVSWGPVSGAALSLGWRLQVGGLAHSGLQAPPGVADCPSPPRSVSSAHRLHCSVSPSEHGAPLSSCTVHPPAGCRAPGRVRGAASLLLRGSEVRAGGGLRC